MKDIMLLDGGIGQELVKRNLSTKDPLWSARVLLDNFELVKNLHIEFLNSGSTIITTNSYSCTPQRLKRFNLENEFKNLQKLALRAAKEAKTETALNNNVKIAGCFSPLPGSYFKDKSISKKEMIETYLSIGELQKDDVDFFIIETMSSIDEAVNAVEALSNFNKKILLCFCLLEGDGTKLFSGEDLKKACDLIQIDKISGLCLNCSQFEDISIGLDILKKYGLPFGALPNNFQSVKPLKLGMSVDNIKKRNDILIEDFVNYSNIWLKKGCTILGGCCEITPDYINGLNQFLMKNKYNKVNFFN